MCSRQGWLSCWRQLSRMTTLGSARCCVIRSAATPPMAKSSTGSTSNVASNPDCFTSCNRHTFDSSTTSPKFGRQLRKSCFLNRCHGALFMRTGYFYSLVFALLTSASIAAVAAPAVKPEAGNAPQVQQMSAETPSGKVDLNKADASTLQSELSGIGEAKAQAIVAYRESNG